MSIFSFTNRKADGKGVIADDGRRIGCVFVCEVGVLNVF